MKNIMDMFKRKEPTEPITFATRHNEAKRVIGELLSLGAKVDGIIVVVSVNREPCVMAGGIDNEYEALGLLDHAKHEVNSRGLPL